MSKKLRVKTIPAKDGHKAISFHEGGLHQSTGTAPDKKISHSKISAALSGSLGSKAKKQANFMRNVLTGGR